MVKPKITALVSFIWIISLLTAVNAYGAKISVKLDRTILEENESFEAIFSTDGSVDGDPDFSELTQDFQILSRTQSSNIQIVNGQFSNQTTWTVTLMPKRNGDLLIPGVAFGQDKSPALKVFVKKVVANSQQKGNDPVFLEVEATPKQTYVQAQLILTIKIFHTVSFVSATMDELSVNDPDAVIEKIIENKTYDKLINGNQYRVFEKSYAIFPQKAGKLKVAPVIFNGQYFDRFRTLHNKRLKSEEINIDVKAKPPIGQFADAWLPVRGLQLTEEWSPTNAEVKVGEPITRTLTVQAQGISGAQLPVLNSKREIAGSKQYPDQPVIRTDKTSEGINGYRQEKTAYIPTKSGKVVLPEVTLSWWNTEKDRLEIARLPAKTITVLAGANVPTNSGSVASTESSATQSGEGQKDLRQLAADSGTFAGTSRFWYWVSIVALCGWIITLIAWLVQYRRASRERVSQAQRRAVRESPGGLLRKIKSASAKNDAQQVKNLLLQWGQTQWPENPPSSIGHIIRRTEGDLAVELQKLNAILYRAKHQPSWSADGLWSALQAYSKNSVPLKNKPKNEIEPLFKLVSNE